MSGMTPVAALTIKVLKRACLDPRPGLTDTQIAEIEAVSARSVTKQASCHSCLRDFT
jgi:hypothetical protein